MTRTAYWWQVTKYKKKVFFQRRRTVKLRLDLVGFAIRLWPIILWSTIAPDQVWGKDLRASPQMPFIAVHSITLMQMPDATRWPSPAWTVNKLIIHAAYLQEEQSSIINLWSVPGCYAGFAELRVTGSLIVVATVTANISLDTQVSSALRCQDCIEGTQ